MENKSKYLKDPQKLLRIIGACISALSLVFEIIILVQYFNKESSEAWKIALLVSSSVVLDVLCVVDLYFIKKLPARIAVYTIDFLILLFFCAVTASPYIVALYCVILSELYINVEKFRTRLIVFSASCFAYSVTLVVGWFIKNRVAITNDQILGIVSDIVTGLIVLSVHFAVASFLLGFYRTNLRLTAALKEASESRAELEAAYDKLSETAALEERNRIARDIHDNAGHSMTAVIMQTEAAKLLIDSSPEEAKAKIIAANIQAKNALDQMRDSVHLLAGRTASMTLKDEVEEIIAQTMDGTDIKIRSDLNDIELDGARRRFICNSLKELLANGMRHGGATAFYVELAEEMGKVSLIVSDNGSGLPENFKEGFGLKGIREKAAAYGGKIVYESESGDGCEIIITIDTEERSDTND